MCRIFLKRLRDVLRIPVLALVDADPYGLKILSVYMKGATQSCNQLCGCHVGDADCQLQSTNVPTEQGQTMEH